MMVNKCNHLWEKMDYDYTEGHQGRLFININAVFYCKKCLKVKYMKYEKVFQEEKR
jgi:hypothetical protein